MITHRHRAARGLGVGRTFTCPNECALGEETPVQNIAPLPRPCGSCGSIRCRAFLERIVKGRFSYDCQRRIAERQAIEIAALKAKVADLEADHGRWTNCIDCGCDLMTSATRCANCHGVDPVQQLSISFA